MRCFSRASKFIHSNKNFKTLLRYSPPPPHAHPTPPIPRPPKSRRKSHSAKEGVHIFPSIFIRLHRLFISAIHKLIITFFMYLGFSNRIRVPNFSDKHFTNFVLLDIPPNFCLTTNIFDVLVHLPSYFNPDSASSPKIILSQKYSPPPLAKIPVFTFSSIINLLIYLTKNPF